MSMSKTVQTAEQTTQTANDFLQEILLAAKKKQTPQQKKVPKKAAADLNIFFRLYHGQITAGLPQMISGRKAVQKHKQLLWLHLPKNLLT